MYTLDICISFDDTGSMSSVRKIVRQNITQFVKGLFANYSGLRIAVIIHNDYCDAPRHLFVQDFTTDLDTITKFVNQDSPCGGGDAAECYELAIHTAHQLNWQSDKRVFILIGDEVPHNVGYTYNSHRNELDWRVETNQCAEKNIQIYSIQALGNRSSNLFYDTIAKLTGGVKLELAQFQHIHTYINAILSHQNGTLDEYQATDAQFNSNYALRNMFNKLRGVSDSVIGDISERIELLSKFQVLKVAAPTIIRDFVELNGCTFQRGKGYYQLLGRVNGKANSEKIQANKEVIFVDKETGVANADTVWCRQQLGIPYGVAGTVRPLNLPEVMNKYDVYIQSNSYTRVLDEGTTFLYELDAK